MLHHAVTVPDSITLTPALFDAILRRYPGKLEKVILSSKHRKALSIGHPGAKTITLAQEGAADQLVPIAGGLFTRFHFKDAIS